MNDYSLNETASRARLAAKGAGYDWGLADEVYRSVFWLIRYNLPAPLMLNKLLSHYQTSADVEQSMPSIIELTYKARGSWLCPILLGCAMTDHIDNINADAKVYIYELKCPLLLLPFIAEIAIKLDRVVVVNIDAHLMATDGKQVQFSSAEVSQLDHVKNGQLTFVSRAEFNFDVAEALPMHSRVNIDSATWDALDAFARNTYAPATDASRNLGAGAGTSDND